MPKLDLTLKDHFRRARRAIEEDYGVRVYIGDSTFYQSGQLPRWQECRSDEPAPLLEPLAIPRFVPHRYYARYAF